MNRLTTKINDGIMYAINGDLTNYLKNCYMIAGDSINKLGQLEDIEEELGIDLIQFLKAAKYTLDNSSMTKCKMPDGTLIRTDYGYVEDWIAGIKKYLGGKIND